MSERILFLSHSHAFGPFRVGSHHYARTLAAQGADVVHLSTPISLAHRVTGRISREAAAVVPTSAHCDADGVTHLIPRTLAPAPYGRFRVARALKREGIDTTFDAVLIDQPLLWDASVPTLAPRLVYRPTDLYPSGVKNTLQRRIAASVDGIVATSSEVLHALGPVQAATLVIENGVDATRFAANDDDEPRPDICAYVGALDARFDDGRVDAWARSHPRVRFTIAGPGGAPATLRAPNIDVIGAMPYDELPQLLRSARVGLLPLSDDPVNAGRSPMKLYEYLAAGLAVVARETPVIRADEANGVFTYTGPDDADAALERALAHPSPNVPGVRCAAAESWDAKTHALREFVFGLPGH
ncbi:glycosyltransferase [Microbacterium sp. KR10-403]|uniref:glycosyltransferase n=1 Tax=Microbacterium sp. KR10-403 TaxID=3158581 RepID=UPI0032E4CFEE